MSEYTLQFPAHIAKEIGLGVNEIAALRRLGCPFYGKKTSIQWVRLFLDRTSGAEALRIGYEFPQCPLAKLLEDRDARRPSSGDD